MYYVNASVVVQNTVHYSCSTLYLLAKVCPIPRSLALHEFYHDDSKALLKRPDTFIRGQGVITDPDLQSQWSEVKGRAMFAQGCLRILLVLTLWLTHQKHMLMSPSSNVLTHPCSSIA